jgi:hypothetical protein
VEHREHKQRLIPNRRTAAIAVALTGYVAALTLRAAFSQSPHTFHWILSLGHLLPSWAVWAANVAFYVCLLCLCIAFPLSLRGKERVLVAGWVPGVLLSPVQGVVSVSVAAAIQHVKAVSMVIAFVAAVLILLEGPASASAPPADTVPG